MKTIKSIFSLAGIIVLLIISSCTKEPVTNIISTDGVNISFENTGQGEPAIILIHGWSNTRSIWSEQVARFSEKYQVIAVDLPGFGQSGNNRSDWSIPQYGDDIASLIQQLNLDEVVIVGFSLGAPIAIEAANRVPNQVIGVVLVDDLHEVEMQIPPPMAHWIDSLMMDLVTYPTEEKLVGMGFFKHNIDSSLVRVKAFLDGVSQVGWRESLAGYIYWQNNHCISVIDTTKVPIIAINSDMQPTNTEAFRKYVPDFKAIITEDVGHVIMWDKPEEFNRLLEESIQEFLVK